MPSCGCGRRFSSSTALDQHQKSKRHCYCQICDRHFPTEGAAEQHRSAVHFFKCSDCEREFTQQESLQKHQRSKGHSYCKECDQFFVNKQALNQHLRSPAHATQFRCCDCDRDFIDELALRQHLADKVHPQDVKCRECDRSFKDKNALQQHRSSVAHNPLSNIKCIGDKDCKKRFNCPSAQLHHLESGACRSRITRQKLNTIIMASDTKRMITSDLSTPQTRQLLAGYFSAASPKDSVILTPVSEGWASDFYPSPGFGALPSRLLTPQSSSSGYKSGNTKVVSRFSCDLCPSNRKPFGSLQALQNHLSSPAHAIKIFHCPLAFASFIDDPKSSNSVKHFSTLSGLAQHLEIGACKGGDATFRKAAEYIQEELWRTGFVGLRLLN